MKDIKSYKNPLIEYIRTPKKTVAKIKNTKSGKVPYLTEIGGNPIGVIVAIGPGMVGYSVCNTASKFDYAEIGDVKLIRLAEAPDDFSKEVAFDIALSRAEMSPTERLEFLKETPLKIKKRVDKMVERSYAYYKQ